MKNESNKILMYHIHGELLDPNNQIQLVDIDIPSFDIQHLRETFQEKERNLNYNFY